MGTDGETSVILGEDTAKWPKVGIVILNWNNYEDTSRCLESLENIDYPNYLAYLIDNGSDDGSRDKLDDEFANKKWVRWISNGENLGFAAGCNPGIDQALSDGCDYVLLFNNDCVAYRDDFLKYGVRTAESQPNCGIIGGKILYWANNDRIWSTGGEFNLWLDVRYIGHDEPDVGQYDEVSKRDFVSGALMLVKDEVFERIEYLPEEYFFGKEDWEFSLRANRAGFDLIYCPRFTVYHEASDSHDTSDPAFIYNGVASKILFKRRNMRTGKFYVWYSIYRVYIKYLLPIRYRFERGQFNQEVLPKLLFHAMEKAVEDAPDIESTSREFIEGYQQPSMSED